MRRAVRSFDRLVAPLHQFVMALGAVVALSACGLQPMYAGGDSGAVAQGLAAVDVPAIEGKAGWLVRNALIDRMLSAKGAGGARFRLDVHGGTVTLRLLIERERLRLALDRNERAMWVRLKATEQAGDVQDIVVTAGTSSLTVTQGTTITLIVGRALPDPTVPSTQPTNNSVVEPDPITSTDDPDAATSDTQGGCGAAVPRQLP